MLPSPTRLRSVQEDTRQGADPGSVVRSRVGLSTPKATLHRLPGPSHQTRTFRSPELNCQVLSTKGCSLISPPVFFRGEACSVLSRSLPRRILQDDYPVHDCLGLWARTGRSILEVCAIDSAYVQNFTSMGVRACHTVGGVLLQCNPWKREPASDRLAYKQFFPFYKNSPSLSSL